VKWPSYEDLVLSIGPAMIVGSLVSRWLGHHAGLVACLVTMLVTPFLILRLRRAKP